MAHTCCVKEERTEEEPPTKQMHIQLCPPIIHRPILRVVWEETKKETALAAWANIPLIASEEGGCGGSLQVANAKTQFSYHCRSRYPCTWMGNRQLG
jgi:hypothetical protein